MDKPASGRMRDTSVTRVYSKSGCRTCKYEFPDASIPHAHLTIRNRIRRVKCDKTRPGCRRCTSTGRICDGYGIWGGGPAATPPARGTLHDLSARSRVGPQSDLERASFNWFRHRATVKLCGVFSSRFWDTLVLQASMTDPPVLHALLALGSAHRNEIMRSSPQQDTSDECEKRQRFTLEQYNKAIVCLRPHFEKTEHDVSSTRTVLITCVVFVCLELLQGRYVQGQRHLENGLNLLNQLQEELRTAGTRGLLVVGHPQESLTEDYLVEAFSRLYAQSSLFGRIPGGCCKSHAIATIIAGSTIQSPPPLFGSMSQARQHLDALFNAIHCLTVQRLREGRDREASIKLLDSQNRILTGLRLWQRAYKVSRLNLTSQLNPLDALSYPLLSLYHTMATVMTSACLSPPGESIYDSFTESFVSVVSTCEEMLKDAVETVVEDKEAGYCSAGFSFTADIGLIAPLFYTAIKCRVRSLRCRAIKLLETATHRESIWDGTAAARIAREVVKIEEEGFCSDTLSHDSQTDEPRMLGPWRVRQVLVDLSNSLDEKARLTCERRREDDEWELTVKTMKLS